MVTENLNNGIPLTSLTNQIFQGIVQVVLIEQGSRVLFQQLLVNA